MWYAQVRGGPEDCHFILPSPCMTTYIVQKQSYYVPCTMYLVRCTMYIVHSTMYIVPAYQETKESYHVRARTHTHVRACASRTKAKMMYIVLTRGYCSISIIYIYIYVQVQLLPRYSCYIVLCTMYMYLSTRALSVLSVESASYKVRVCIQLRSYHVHSTSYKVLCTMYLVPRTMQIVHRTSTSYYVLVHSRLQSYSYIVLVRCTMYYVHVRTYLWYYVHPWYIWYIVLGTCMYVYMCVHSTTMCRATRVGRLVLVPCTALALELLLICTMYICTSYLVHRCTMYIGTRVQGAM